MHISFLKKLFVDRFRKRPKNPYIQTELQRATLSGAGGVLPPNNRIASLKNWMIAKKRQSRAKKERSTYGRKKTRISPLMRLGVILFLGGGLLSFVAIGGRDGVEKRLADLDFFKVDEIVFSGAAKVPLEKLRDGAAIILHQTSLIGLRTEPIAERIASIPWVAKATVKRSWPSTIKISIKENDPVALMNIISAKTAQLYYIDAKGKLFLPVEPGADLDFPVITGLSAMHVRDVKGHAFKEVLVLLKKLRNNNPHLPAQSVSEIHVTRAGEIIVYLVEYPFPIYFGNGNTKKKYSRLVQVLKALYKKKKGKELISRVEYIQMEYLHDKVLVAQSGSG